jgi:hypothetical protein
MAAVFSDVITGSGRWDCEACSQYPKEWDRRGRCVGPIADGPEGLLVTIRRRPKGASEYASQETGKAYPDLEFDQCPRALLRPEVFPAEVAAAHIVSQAVHAEVHKRWPELPGRLWQLVSQWNVLRLRREGAEREAYLTESS